MTILQQKNQIIADREALLSHYERETASTRPRADKSGDQRPERSARSRPRREAVPRRSVSRREHAQRARARRSPTHRNVRSRRSSHEEHSSTDYSYRPASDRSPTRYSSNESTDSLRSRHRSWDSREEFEDYHGGAIRDVSRAASRSRHPRPERHRIPVHERLGMTVGSGHFGVPVDLAMQSHGTGHSSTGQGPFSREIRRYRIPRDLRKPPNLNKFDGRGDPDKHLRYFNNYCSYRDLGPTMKCRLFPQSLDGRALEWWENLRPNTISSWGGLVATFLANYTANRCQYRYEEHLDTIVQGLNEPLREYIDRFNSEADTVRDLTDRDKLKYLKRGIRGDHRFAEEFTLNHYNDLGMFLRRANDHMAYEERLAAKRVARERPREINDRPSEGHNGGQRESHAKHEQRTGLNAPIAQIFAECQSNEFAGVKRPDPFVLKKGGRATNKYCRYHKSKGHDTNECMALKDDIEDLIQRGKLGGYVRTDHDDRPEETTGEQPVQRKGKETMDGTDRPSDREVSEDRDIRHSRGRRVAM